MILIAVALDGAEINAYDNVDEFTGAARQVYRSKMLGRRHNCGIPFPDWAKSWLYKLQAGHACAVPSCIRPGGLYLALLEQGNQSVLISVIED